MVGGWWSQLVGGAKPPRFRPRLDEAAFIAALAPASDEVRAAHAAWVAGDAVLAQAKVVAHFVQRAQPRFFCDPEQVAVLARHVRDDHPAWADAVCRRVRADLRLGLSVASRRAAPLEAGFGWEQLPRGPGCDTLYSAQPHRFGFMPRLALAAHHGVATAQTIDRLLADWIAAARAGEPECYHSPLVVVFRVVALSWAFVIVAGLPDAPPALLFKLLLILGADADYLEDTIGHSYNNNHLLADGFAGWFYGSLYPEFPSAAQARRDGEAIFLRELRRQFLADGSNFEHSIHYHELGCEMAAAYVLLSRRNAVEPPADVVAQLRAMLAFQAATSGGEAVPLAIGDTTEDPLFPLDAEHGWAAGAMRELYRALFDPALAPAPGADVTVERAYWLLGGALAAAPPRALAELPARFADGGFFIQHDVERQARLLLRSGPVPGQPISAGHAHADLLSVYLSVDGRPLIVDAGTYTYRYGPRGWPAGTPPWRAYFAGPQAHNGLAPAQDPLGAMVGDFRDRDVPARVVARREQASDGLAWLEFEVVGGPASGHRRGLVQVLGSYWLVYDLVPYAVAAAGASVGLQFAPAVQWETAAAAAIDFTLDGARCRVAHSGTAVAAVHCGSLAPLAGWVSPRYGELKPAPQWRVALPADGTPTAFLLQPRPGAGAAVSALRLEVLPGGLGFEVLHEGGDVDRMLLRTDAAAPLVLRSGKFSSDGDLAWLRCRDDVMQAARTLGGGLRYADRSWGG